MPQCICEGIKKDFKHIIYNIIKIWLTSCNFVILSIKIFVDMKYTNIIQLYQHNAYMQYIYVDMRGNSSCMSA